MGKILIVAGAVIISLLVYENRKPRQLISPFPKGAKAYSSVRGVATALPTVIRGKASWYGAAASECLGCSPNRITASDQKFNDLQFTAACAKRWALGATLEVRYREKMVRIICTDRGRFEVRYGRVLDLAKAAFAELAPLDKGIIKVEIAEIK